MWYTGNDRILDKVIVMIEEVLKLYKDCSSNVVKLMKNALSYLFTVDKESCENLCKLLFDLKIRYPGFRIIISEKHSCFLVNENKVYLEIERANFLVLFHELVHVFHYYMTDFTTPNKFGEIVDRIKKSDDFEKNCVDVMKYLEERKKLILEHILLKFREIKTNDEIYDKSILELEAIRKLEDIIDALTSGMSHDKGLCFVKDTNSLAEKSMMGSGHGVQYFNTNDANVYVEIIADYGAIRNSEFREMLIGILRLSFGDELTEFLEENYQKLVGGLVLFDKKNTVRI